MEPPYVKEVVVYPIKSCGGVSLSSVSVTPLGLEYDREWMIVGNSKRIISQRIYPQLARVAVAIDNNNYLEVHTDEIGTITIKREINDPATEVPVSVFDKPGTGRIVSQETSAYFSEYLKTHVNLVQIHKPRTILSQCHVENASTVTGFADGFPILLANSDSLDSLNQRLASPVSMDRFRANIVVGGVAEYEEDYWRTIRIGSLTAHIVRGCARCPIPDVNQQLGTLDPSRPVMRALRGFRAGTDIITGKSGVFFGQNVTHQYRPSIEVAVGDTLEIVAKSQFRNIDLPQVH